MQFCPILLKKSTENSVWKYQTKLTPLKRQWNRQHWSRLKLFCTTFESVCVSVFWFDRKFKPSASGAASGGRTGKPGANGAGCAGCVHFGVRRGEARGINSNFWNWRTRGWWRGQTRTGSRYVILVNFCAIYLFFLIGLRHASGFLLASLFPNIFGQRSVVILWHSIYEL